jgi:6-phosphogluconolactonase
MKQCNAAWIAGLTKSKQHSETVKVVGSGGNKLWAICLSIGLLGGLLSLTGCSSFFTAQTGSGTPTGSTTYAYVTNVGAGGSGGTLTAYSLTSGVLTQLAGSPITLPATPTSVVVAPNNAFLFVGTQLGVFLYTIATDGTLTEGNTNTIVYLGPTYTESMAIDSTSSWLVIANNKSTELDALPLDPTTGIPTAVTPATVALSNASPVSIGISPSNGTVFAALGTGGTNVWSFDASNATTPFGKTRNNIALAKGSTSANAVITDTTSTYLYIAETTSSTSADTLRSLTLATLDNEVDYPTGKLPSAILADASGAYVYVTNQTDNTITGYALSAGVLTELTDSPYSTGKAPLGIVEDSTKSYVITIGYGNNPNLWLYSFDATTAGDLDVAKTTTTGSANPSLSNSIALTH